jgi:tRNA A37 threonylcarbamoyladenosine dehydratase
MKKIINTLWLLFFITNVHAQKPCSILSANAFYSVVMPGTMPVDENGNPRKIKPNLARTIFISSNCNITPVISKVIYDNTSIPFFIEKTTNEEVSNLMDDMNNKIKLSAAKSSFIWKIIIVPSGGVSVPENPTTISIQWKQKTKINKLVVKKEMQLATFPTY